MKKWLVSVAAVLVLLIAGIYVFIPAEIKVSSVEPISASANSNERLLFDTAKWRTWWTSTDSAGNSLAYTDGKFQSGDMSFEVTRFSHFSLDVSIKTGGNEYQSRILMVAAGTDSSTLQWALIIDGGKDPLTRAKQYSRAVDIKKEMEKVLAHFRSYAQNPENIYGIRFIKTSIRDTIFISRKESYTFRPGTKEIYKHIEELSAYAEKNGATPGTSTIYNIMQLDSTHYQLMTAVPINKFLEGDASHAFKRMIPGSFIVAEVKGGEATVDAAGKSLENYFSDYRKTSMAMNFQMLVTNRLETPDSTQWITRLYRPVY